MKRRARPLTRRSTQFRKDTNMARMKLSMAIVLVAASWGSAIGGEQCDPEEVGHLFASDGAPDTFFGVSVAISGDTAVVGNPDDDTARGVNAGSAYVYVRVDGIWKEEAHLFAPDGAANDLFGNSVAI